MTTCKSISKLCVCGGSRLGEGGVSGVGGAARQHAKDQTGSGLCVSVFHVSRGDVGKKDNYY